MVLEQKMRAYMKHFEVIPIVEKIINMTQE
jgi:translation initiation factor 2 beta subunit (eIF-2beta)/eIF-5